MNGEYLYAPLKFIYLIYEMVNVAGETKAKRVTLICQNEVIGCPVGGVGLSVR